MTERQNKKYEPTTVEEMHEKIASEEISSFLSLFERQDLAQIELRDSGFINHFAAALGSDVPLGAIGRTYVKQQLSSAETGESIRTVIAVYEQMGADGATEYREVVGQVLDDAWVADAPFTYQDMKLAVRQLDALQAAVNNGELDLDESLSAARNITAVIAHGF